MPVWFKPIAGNIVALAVGLGFSVAVLESSARIAAGALGLTAYMMYDQLLGWTARPNTTKRHRDRIAGFDVTYRINRHGFRGKAYDRPKPAGAYRVVVLGDSNGFGWGVSEDATFAALLEHFEPNVQIVNLSLSGYGTDQQYLRFVKEGIAFFPDLVVLQLTTNDFEEIQNSFFNRKPKPQFLLTEAGTLRLANVPVRSTGPKAYAYARNSLPLPFGEWLQWNSYSYQFLNEKYYHVRRHYAPRLDVEDVTSGVITRDSVRLFTRIVSELVAKSTQIGARLLIIHASKELNANEVLLGSGLDVVDLYPAFAHHRRAHGVDAFFSDGYHWNAEGHRVAARELLAVLRARNYLGSGAKPGN